MNVKYSFFLFCCVLCLAAQSQQGTVKLDLSYNVAMPVGNFKKLTDKTALNGWHAAVVYNITDQVGVGLQTGFQDFYQKYNRQVYHGSGSDLSAVVSNSVQLVPLLLKGVYTFSTKGMVRPFVGLGVGGSLVQYRKFYGQFADSHSAFSFSAQPALGVQVPVGQARRTTIHLGAAYTYLPYKGLDADGLNHVSLKAGLAIPLRQ